jgi:hypothetical protein
MIPLRQALGLDKTLYQASKTTGVDAKTLSRLCRKDALWCERTGKVYIESKTVIWLTGTTTTGRSC